MALVGIIVVTLLATAAVVVIRRRQRATIVRYGARSTRPKEDTSTPRFVLGAWSFLSIFWGIFVLVGIVTGRPFFLVAALILWIARIWKGFGVQRILSRRIQAYHDSLPAITQARLAMEIANYDPQTAITILKDLPKNEATRGLTAFALSYTASAEQAWSNSLRNAVASTEQLASTMLARLKRLERGAGTIAFVQGVGMAFLAGVVLFLDVYITFLGEVLAVTFLLVMFAHNYFTDAFLRFGGE